jgi:hypothetical protein
VSAHKAESTVAAMPLLVDCDKKKAHNVKSHANEHRPVLEI